MTTAVDSPTWATTLPDYPVALSVRPSAVLAASADGTAVALDPATGAQEHACAVPDGLLAAELSPNGRRALLCGPDGALLWTLGDEPVPIGPRGWASRARWADDEVGAVAVGKRVVIADTTTGQQWASTPMPSTVTDLAWIGGRRTIAVAAYGGVTLLDATPDGRSAVKSFVGSLLALATTRDGRWIVSGNQDASLQVFSAARDTRLEMQGFHTKITRVAFDASEEHLANDGAPEVTVWGFRGRGPEGTAPSLVTESEGPGTADTFAWHPRSPFLATAWRSGRIEVADVRRGKRGKPLPGTEVGSVGAQVAALAWTDDGRGLMVADRDGRVQRITAIVR